MAARKHNDMRTTLINISGVRGRALVTALIIFAALVIVPALFLVSAQENKPGAGSSPAGAIRTAERNVQTNEGQFKARLRQSPPDPRDGEEVKFAVDLSEQVEGGGGLSAGGLLPVTGATVTARVTTAAGGAVAKGFVARPSEAGSYRLNYAFPDGGEFKLIFDVRTSDNRQFAADFPVSIAPAPTNWVFWLGLGILILISAGTVFGYYSSWKRDGVEGKLAARKTLPVAAGAFAFFVIGVAALAYFQPPRERFPAADLPAAGTQTQSPGESTASGDPSLGGSGARIVITKESQLLFNIRTAVVEQRKITSGLKVTGTVHARPNAQAIISPPVSGRVFFNGNISVGTAVGRGERIGTIEQVLGAPEQASLEGQKVGLQTAALEQQAKQAEQIANAQQARARLVQAERELRRATNLLEVGAAPKKRVEEAQTAVLIAKQEVEAAEKQASVAGQQVKLSRESVARVNPVRTFPLVSPVTGIIKDLKATTGQQVEAGAQLMEVINLTTVFLEAQVFEKDLSTVRDSRRAAYTAAGMPGEVYQIGGGGDGRLVTIGQTVDPQTRTVPVVFEVTNPLNHLRDGMFVEITIDTTGENKVLSVPKQSVITEQGRTYVYVFEGGEVFEKRVVVVGSEGADYYEIKSGVKEGERVVVEGIYQLRSTQPGG